MSDLPPHGLADDVDQLHLLDQQVRLDLLIFLAPASLFRGNPWRKAPN